MNWLKRLVTMSIVIIIALQTTIIATAETVNIINRQYDFKQAVAMAKISAEVYEKLQDNNTATVYIWLDDIEQDEVEEVVKKEIGYGKEYLSNSYGINNYELDELTTTRDERIKEKVITDNYVSKKRDIAKQMHIDKKKGIEALNRVSDSIIFESQYAPFVVAELSTEEVEQLVQNEEVVEIGLYSNNEEQYTFNPVFNNGNYDEFYVDDIISQESMQNFKKYLTVSGIDKLKQDSGLSGEGVSIGAVDMVSFLSDEKYLPKSRCFSNQNLTALEASDTWHATCTALMMAGNNGIADKSNLYMLESAETAFITDIEAFVRNMEYFISNDISLINISNGFPGDAYPLLGKYVDYIISNYDLIIVKSAGGVEDDATEFLEDDADYITHPGASDNIITVGAYENKLTAIKTDDTMTSYSAFIDEELYDFLDENGNVIYEQACDKPDLVAPEDALCGGTSIAAPFVTGVIALIVECRPSLALQPEVVKAILMASCHYKAKKYWITDSQETMTQGITEKQGAGVIDPYTALSITANGNYGYGIIEENTTESIRFHQSPYDATGMNVSIAWLRDVNRINNSYTYTNRNDLNLYVNKNGSSVFEKDENGNEIGTNKHSSSTEMVYSPINSDTRNFATEITYDIEITYENDTTDNSSESVRYGYAWSTDDEDYYSIFEYEGLYLIKNTASNKYLTYNTDNNTLSLMDYMGHYYNEYEQLFVVSNDYTPGYFISDAFCITESNPYFINDGLTKNGTNLSYSTNPTLIQIIRNSEGQYILLADGMVLNYGNGLIWDYWDKLSGGQFWTFEKVNYKKGDVDMNGVINSTDQNYISGFYNGIYSPTNAEKYLSDTNGDHEINNGD